MSQEFSRRSFFGLAAAGAATAMTGLPSVSRAEAPYRGREVKNIIWMVSDGMSMGVPSMVDHYQQLLHGRRSIWRRLLLDPKAVHAHMDTRSLDSMVTDSAAASTSWGSGVHVLNGSINTLPGVADLTPLYDVMGKAGLKRGLVTTATITHATPSGFAVAVRSRSAEPEIALQYRTRGVEVLMGGGHEFFSAEKRKDKTDVYGLYEKDGYAVCQTRDQMNAAPDSGKLLGVYSTGYIPYTIDRDHSPELQKTVPTLAEMTEKALSILKKGSDGFILQVEGGRVDHAAHANDLGALIFDQMAFEDAMRVCLDFAKEDGETLVVITTDHGNANPGISPHSELLVQKNGLVKVKDMKSSYQGMAADLKKASTAQAMRDLIEEKMSIGITSAEAQILVDAMNGRSMVKVFGNYTHSTAALAMVLGSYTGIGWVSGEHTSDYVMMTSYGPGSELFAGFVQNVECFGKMLSLRGQEFRNPEITLAEALANREKEGVRAEVMDVRHPQELMIV